MAARTLSEWLEYIERIHPKSIELGLERVTAVKRRLALELEATIVTVAGTNGKGSTCAMLESVLLAAGYRVGLYTSPHLLRYNERVRINGTPVDDESLCRAFARVEAVRDGVPLTYFEFGTLAAWIVFAGAPFDALILEVGMGGRLDAVNAFDAHCAVVTSIAIDHRLPRPYARGNRPGEGRHSSCRPAGDHCRSPTARIGDRACGCHRCGYAAPWTRIRLCFRTGAMDVLGHAGSA